MAVAVGAVKAGERLFPVRWLPLDYRFAAFGAVLPDLIDKPPAYFLGFGDPHGHTHAHTLVFAAAVILFGVWWAGRTADARLLLVGFGSLSHLIVDPVIIFPQTLFWPLFGLDFAHSMGIPSSYLRIFDAILVASFALAAWRFPSLRTRAKAFVETGAV
jgi:hypothetical protein